MPKHSQWAFRLAQIPYHPKLFRQRPLRHSAPCLLWTNRLYHPFSLLSWPNAWTRIRLGNERPHHRWGRLAEMAITRRRWWGGRIKLPKQKIQDAYTLLLYMCASWIFSLFATNSLIIGGTQTVRPFPLLPQFAHYCQMMQIAPCPSLPFSHLILKLQHPHSVAPSFPKTLRQFSAWE